MLFELSFVIRLGCLILILLFESIDLGYGFMPLGFSYLGFETNLGST